MSRTLAPMATKWVPLAMAPRLPLAYLLCDNQLFFRFSDEELRELGSHRRRLPRYETRQAFPPGLEGERGRPHGRTVPRLLEMHRSQGTPLHPRAACRLRSLVHQRVPQPAQGGWRWAKPRPLRLQQRPRTLKHGRAACRPWPLVWERAPWLAKRGRLRGRVLLLQQWLHRRRSPFTMIWASKRQAGTSRELPSAPPLPRLRALSTRLRKRRRRLLQPEVVQWSAGMAAPVDPAARRTFGRLFRLRSSRRRHRPSPIPTSPWQPPPSVRRLMQVGEGLHSARVGTLCHVTALMQSSGRRTRGCRG
jgi:hypothetical protein